MARLAISFRLRFLTPVLDRCAGFVHRFRPGESTDLARRRTVHRPGRQETPCCLLVLSPIVLRRTIVRWAVAVTCVMVGTVAIQAADGRTARPAGRDGLAPRVASLAGSNWAGYIAEGTPGEFTTASADWVIAAVSCRSDQDIYAPWVGIDGDGDNTVEQTGVETTCASGSPVSKAWYEMYPARPVFFKDPVSTGDAFSGSVSYSTSTRKFEITITDVTQGWTKSVTKADVVPLSCSRPRLSSRRPGRSRTIRPSRR